MCHHSSLHGQVCTLHRCFFDTNVHICEHTRCRLSTYVYIHIYVYMHAYVYGYVYASIILLDTLRRRLSVRRCAYACICICVCMYACICARVYACICIYVCLCICMHIHLYTHKRVVLHMHSCRRILFICTVQSLYYMRVYHRCSITPACVCVGGSEVGFFPACSWLVLVAGVGGYVLAGVEIGGLSCIFLYFCGC